MFPTQVFIPAERQAAGLTLRNTGEAELHAQVRVFAWSQVDGEDRLEPTDSLAISPPMASLAPGEEQLVRVVRLQSPPGEAEQAFRLVVDELPGDDAPAVRPSTGLQLVLRYSVPVFVLPATRADAPAPVLDTRMETADGRRFIAVHNGGQGHAQLASLSIVEGETRHVVAPGLSGYVLPGQMRRWAVPENVGALGGMEIRARINGEASERVLASIAPAN